jgi:hypothetical protein
MEPKQNEIDVVSIYRELEDREVDLIVTLVNLFDLLKTKYSNERELLDYVKFELEGYVLDDISSINDLPSYRKVDIGAFKLPNRSEPLKLIKVIERMEGKTIVTPGIQQLRDGYSFEHIEDLIYIQNRAYEWEEFPRDDKEKTLVANLKDNPKKIIDDSIRLKMESGLREILCLKLKTTFPQIQEQIFDKKIKDLTLSIKQLQLANQRSQWPWKNILRSKTGENVSFWGIYISKKTIDKTKELVQYCFQSRKRIAAAFTAIAAGGSTIWVGLEDMVRIILKFFGVDI